MNQLPRCQLEVGITPTEPTETIGTGMKTDETTQTKF